MDCGKEYFNNLLADAVYIYMCIRSSSKDSLKINSHCSGLIFHTKVNEITSMEAPWLDRNTMELWLKVPVKEIHSEDTSLKGDNYLSYMKNLVVKTESGEVYPLVVKCRIEEGIVADVFGNSSIYKRELEMYRNIQKKMSQLLREAFPDSFDAFTAKCYSTCKSFLVLEDLKASGFKMEDRRIGLDLDQCLLVMRTLARFHASSVILRQQNPRIFEKFDGSVFAEDVLLESMENIWSGMARSLANELDTWGEEWHKYAAKLRNLANVIMKKVIEVTRLQDSDFNVLNHGDLWTNNMMFKDGTDEMRFVDFQLLHFCSPGIDFNYFFISSANLEVRKKHRHRLIEEYHNTLCNTLTALGYNEKLITLEEVYEEIDRKALYGLFTLLGPYAIMQLDVDSGFSFEKALSTGWNPGSAMYGETYKEVVKIMLPIFDSKGAFDINN